MSNWSKRSEVAACCEACTEEAGKPPLDPRIVPVAGAVKLMLPMTEDPAAPKPPGAMLPVHWPKFAIRPDRGALMTLEAEPAGEDAYTGIALAGAGAVILLML